MCADTSGESEKIKIRYAEELRKWLSEHCMSNDGVWLLFGKAGGPKAPEITEEQIDSLCALIEGYEPAYTNFKAMSLSVKKTYTRAYFGAKTDAGRKKRIAWMVDRLNRNLKPM